MLIELINTRNINLDNLQVDTCIQNVLCAHREGKHIVISDENLLKELASRASLGSRNCNTAQTILQRIRELMPLKNKMQYYCKVDMSSPHSDIIQSNSDENYFIVGCNFFNDSSKTQLTKLLCEDINDYKIYKIIADQFKFSKKIKDININFEVVNGGGTRIKNNFEQIKITGRFCFCLLDNDKKHPKSKIGSTAGKFSDSDNIGSCKYFIINSHEVESLIPMGIIKESILQKGLDNSYLFSYDQLNALVDYAPEVKIYFDHKLGITVNEAKKLDEKYHDKFWEMPLLKASNFKRSKCINEMACECKTECLAVPGFSARLLDVGADILSTMNKARLDGLISPILREEWNVIGEKLFSWGCAISQRSRSS